MMKARRVFWGALILAMWAYGIMAQTFQTVAVNGVTAGVTQVLASGGANPANSYAINFIRWSGTQSGAAPVTAAIYTGTVNGESPACNTGRQVLTGALAVPSWTTSGLPTDAIIGSPAVIIAGSAAMCLAVTGGTVNGWMTYQR